MCGSDTSRSVYNQVTHVLQPTRLNRRFEIYHARTHADQGIPEFRPYANERHGRFLERSVGDGLKEDGATGTTAGNCRQSFSYYYLLLLLLPPPPVAHQEETKAQRRNLVYCLLLSTYVSHRLSLGEFGYLDWRQHFFVARPVPSLPARLLMTSARRLTEGKQVEPARSLLGRHRRSKGLYLALRVLSTMNANGAFSLLSGEARKRAEEIRSGVGRRGSNTG